MDLLERIFGAETMARAREAAREAQARAQPAPVPAAPGRAVAAVPSLGAQARASSPAPSDDALPDLPAADFPTSILGTAAAVAPPLLAAFASRDALLAAIVYSEALAPPVALR